MQPTTETTAQAVEGRDSADAPAPLRLRHRILQAGTWVVTGFVLDKLIAAAQLIVLARLLTPADFGLMAASAVVLLALLMLSEVGIEQSLVTRRDVNDTDLAVAWTLSVGRALMLAVCLWIFADAIALFFRMPELASLLRVHSFALLIQGAQSPALAVLLRNLNLRGRVRLDLTRRVVEAVATISLAIWLRSPWALLWGQLIGFAVGCVLSYVIAPFKPSLTLHRSSLTQFVQFGKHVNVTMILIFGVISGGEFVVGRMLGQETLGLYQIALAIPFLLGMRLPIMINQVSLPAYAALRQDRAGTVRAFTLQIGVMSLLLVPAAAILALTSHELVELVFGSSWLGAAKPLQILSVCAVCAGFCGVIASLHYGLNRPDLQTRVWVIQFLCYAVSIVPLTAWFGLVGAAAALSLSYLVGLLLQVIFTLRLLGATAWPAFSASGIGIILVAGIGGALAAVRAGSLGPTAVWALPACALLGVTLYALYLWWVEYPRLRELWRRE